MGLKQQPPYLNTIGTQIINKKRRCLVASLHFLWFVDHFVEDVKPRIFVELDDFLACAQRSLSLELLVHIGI